MISNELKQHIKVGKVCDEVMNKVKSGLRELSTDEIYTYLQRLREEQYDRETTHLKIKFKYLKKEFIREILRAHSEIYDIQLSRLLTELFNRGVDYDELRQKVLNKGFDSLHEETKKKIDKAFEEMEKSEEYQTNTEVRKRIQTMKDDMLDTVMNDFDYISKVRKYSSELMVIAEVRNINNEVYGYIIKNNSPETIELSDIENSKQFTMEPGEEKLLNLEKFVRISAQPEISFKYINGKVCHNKSLSEVIEIEKENNGLIAYNTFHFKQDAGWENCGSKSIKTIYMD